MSKRKGGEPSPGRPVRGSQTGRPIMAALDLLGRRWILRIVWELHQQPDGFRALRTRCDGMSSSVLAIRLTELSTAGLAEATDGRYHLTPLGADLVDSMRPILDWSARWAETLSGEPGSPGHGR